MIVSGATFTEVSSAASMHGMRAIPASGGNGRDRVGVRLMPGVTGPRELYRRYSAEGRRVNAVCWHGHARWLRELFARYGDRPGLKVSTTVPGRPFGMEREGNSFGARAIILPREPATGYDPMTDGRFTLVDWLEYSRDLNAGSEYRPIGAAETCRCAL